MKTLGRLFALVVVLSLPGCADSSAQTVPAAPEGWGACSFVGGGSVNADRARIVYGAQGDAYHIDFDFVVVGRDVAEYPPAPYRPAAFRRGITGGSMGRWMVGLDQEETLWLHDDSSSREGANVFLVEPAEAPDSGLVVVRALTRDLSWDLGPCGGMDSLMIRLNGDEVITDFVGGPIARR